MYQQQRHQQPLHRQQPYQDQNRGQMDPNQVRQQFGSELSTLTFNSKPIITSLTMAAERNVPVAHAIVQTIEERLRSAPTNQKLPALYLIDSILKIVGGPYPNLFERTIVSLFLDAYAVADAGTRASLEKVVGTWPNWPSQLFPQEIVTRIERGMQSMRQQYAANGNQLTANGRYPDPRTSSNRQYGQAPAGRPQEQSDNVLLRDIQLLILQKQQAMLMNPGDQSNARQIGILQQTTELTQDKANMIRQQLSQLWSPPVTMPPVPVPAPSTPTPSPAASMGSMPLPITGAMISASQPPLLPPMPPLPFPTMAASAPMQFPSFPPNLPPQAGSIPIPQSSMIVPPHMPTSAPIPIIPHNPHFGMPASAMPQSPVPATAVPTATPAASDLFASLMQSGLLGPNGTLTNQLLQNTMNLNRASPSPHLSAHGSPVSEAASAAVSQPASDAGGGLLLRSSAQNELDQSVMSIGLIDLNSQDIQKRRPMAVQLMYGVPPLQCNQCGYRCPKSVDAQKKMDSHLDWHFRQNRRMKDKAKKSHSRSWLVGEEDWIHSREGDLSQSQQPVFFDFGTGVNKTSKEQQALQEEMAALREKIVSETVLTQQLRSDGAEDIQAEKNIITKGCSVCKEKFIKVWNDAQEEWSYKNAIVVDKLIYHATCHADLVRSNQRQAAAIAASTSGTLATIDAGRSEMGTDAMSTAAGVTTLIPPMTALTHGDEDMKLDTTPHQHQQEDKDMPLVASGFDVPASLKRKMEQAWDDKNQTVAKRTILEEAS
ncbi:hypothetical protein BG004_004257 [Podila humilis]|nr:hypothetical protein BG004_004257 [Podila humilis]